MPTTFALLSLLIFVLSLTFNNEIWRSLRSIFGNDVAVYSKVIAGVLSARHHFQRRLVVRQTWMKEMNKFSSKAFFIVGDQTCHLPIDDRLEQNSCKEWTVNKSEIESEAAYPISATNILPCDLPSMIYQGISFYVHHPVIVEQLGILASAMLKDSKIEVALLEAATKKIVVKTHFNSLQKGENLKGYLHRRVEAFLLPKGFEGIILIEGNVLASLCSVTKWNNGGGVISFRKIYQTSEDSETIIFRNNVTVAGSMIFKIHDVPKLLQHLQNKEERLKEWEKNAIYTEHQLQIESKKWKDIIFIDVVDVYENLAIKVLEFYKWVAENEDFSFLLKTDDDCLMNVPLIMAKLKHFGNNVWWSRFRKNWPVNHFGKWADHDYSSSVYPMFACGAGNVLSRNLVLWLSKNRNYLYPYKGEDVSVGIWLAGLKPVYIDDDLWICDKNCTSNSYNVAELEVDEIIPAWTNYLHCGDLCNCST